MGINPAYEYFKIYYDQVRIHILNIFATQKKNNKIHIVSVM